ncbi:MAG: hypothetical protein JXB19_00330 [Bacteroidales bacterium]|nr:hypothetical protein [Bacteroidales bacterium]
MDTSFNIMDCALIAIATGEKAQNLRELRDYLKHTHRGCLYYHFWGGLLRQHSSDTEFQNDFANWAHRSLHDARVAEQLSLIDPNIFKDLESLRRELIEVIEQRLYETEYIPWARPGNEFQFTRSQTVVFDTGIKIEHPEQFKDILPNLTLSSIFYHCIDARRRTDEIKSDFIVWLAGFGEQYAELINLLDQIDPYFTTLSELRQEISYVFNLYFKNGG